MSDNTYPCGYNNFGLEPKQAKLNAHIKSAQRKLDLILPIVGDGRYDSAMNLLMAAQDELDDALTMVSELRKG